MSVNNRADYFNRLKGNNTYVLADSVDDRKRLVLQTRLYTPAFKQVLVRAIEKYNLKSKLQDSSASFRILDLGCGEGLYFPIINEVLTELGTTAEVTIVGLDNDTAALATAQDYMAALSLSHLVQVYHHDLNLPLNQLESINLLKPENHFDLVISTAVLMHLPTSRQILLSAFEIIKPGGGFYARDMRWLGGYVYPSPAFAKLDNKTRPLILKRIGDDFAQHHSEYLTEAGFKDLESSEDTYPVGGKTEIGRRILENFLLGMHASRGYLTALGMITELDFDQTVAQMFREINPELEGFITWVNTIAQRPA